MASSSGMALSYSSSGGRVAPTAYFAARARPRADRRWNRLFLYFARPIAAATASGSCTFPRRAMLVFRRANRSPEPSFGCFAIALLPLEVEQRVQLDPVRRDARLPVDEVEEAHTRERG